MRGDSTPPPPLGPDEDVEPRNRRVPGIKCYKCGEDVMWDGRTAIWCDAENCERCLIPCWNADLKDKLPYLSQ